MLASLTRYARKRSITVRQALKRPEVSQLNRNPRNESTVSIETESVVDNSTPSASPGLWPGSRFGKIVAAKRRDPEFAVHFSPLHYHASPSRYTQRPGASRIEFIYHLAVDALDQDVSISPPPYKKKSWAAWGKVSRWEVVGMARDVKMKAHVLARIRLDTRELLHPLTVPDGEKNPARRGQPSSIGKRTWTQLVVARGVLSANGITVMLDSISES
ncbi:hypothetical protein G7046_g3493 [Stylonectria norvegica]|nr:hypothetical protein G7046_g3493 [Stylonectria norvegica]